MRVYEPTAGIFANKAARSMTLSNPFEGMDDEEESFSPSQQMGVGAGGQMTQRIYDDPYGRSVWDDANYGELNIFIVNSEQYAAITNKPAPPTPMSAELYTIYGFPWFKMFDDEIASVAGCEPLNAVRSVQSIVKESGEATIDDDSSLVDELNVTSIDADFVTKGRGKKQSPDKPEQ